MSLLSFSLNPEESAMLLCMLIVWQLHKQPHQL